MTLAERVKETLNSMTPYMYTHVHYPLDLEICSCTLASIACYNIISKVQINVT